MPQLDPASYPTQLFWLAVVFIVLYVLMSRIGLPRVNQVVTARAAKIDGDLGAAADARSRSEALLGEYEQSLAAARAEALATIRATTEAIAREAAEREHELMVKLAAEGRAAEARIAAAKTQALGNIRQIAVEAVQAASTQLVGSSLPGSEIEAAVAQVLTERH